MAGDTVGLLLDHMRRDDVFVTAFTGLIAGRANRVRLVTAAAIPVLPCRPLGEDWLALVAALAARRGRC